MRSFLENLDNVYDGVVRSCRNSVCRRHPGAGSTFAYPLYAKWAKAYKNETGIKVDYQSVGSGAA